MAESFSREKIKASTAEERWRKNKKLHVQNKWDDSKTDQASTIPSIVIYAMVANPIRGHKEVPGSTGHIMVT